MASLRVLFNSFKICQFVFGPCPPANLLSESHLNSSLAEIAKKDLLDLCT